MNSFFENPGLSHIGTKIFLSLDFMNQTKCRQVCKSWNQIIEDLFSNMISKTSLDHLTVLLDEYFTRNSLKQSEKFAWNCFIRRSYEHFEDYNINKYFKLYVKHVLNTTRQRNWFRDYTPTHEFIFLGNIKMVKFIISSNLFYFQAGLKARDKEGNTALHLALKNSELEIAKLIAANVDQECIEIRDGEGRNVIHTAAINGEVECLKLLCQKTGKIDLKVKSDGNTPLHYAAEYGHLDCVEVLMEFKSVRNLAGVSRNEDMLTPVELAQKYNHYEIVDYLNSFIYKKWK